MHVNLNLSSYSAYTPSPSSESISTSTNSDSTSLKSTFHSITSHFSSLSSRASHELVEKGAFSLAQTIQSTKSLISPHLPSALVQGLAVHSDDPLRSAVRWITEHFEFGACMFDPAGLRSRYSQLEQWGEGKWVNLWTEVPARMKLGSESPPVNNTSPKRDVSSDTAYFDESASSIPSNTAEIPEMIEADAEMSQGHGKDSSQIQIEAKEHRKQLSARLRRERESERSHPSSSRPARHFIVLPHARGARTGSAAAGFHFGSRERWERVEIEGAEDEVGAHTGIFMREVNIRYEELVERVGRVVMGWC